MKSSFSSSSTSRPSLSLISPSSTRGHEAKKRLLIQAKKGGEGEGKSIDDNMIILRMRIKKMKVLEARNKASNKEGVVAPQQASSDWKDWERKMFTHYHEDVCQGIELLQSYLMNTRPSLALGTLMLLAMSVPLSSSVVMGNLLKVARGLLAGCHVCIDIDF